MMKIIDLLNKIAKGKLQEVKFIKYKNHEYEYYNGDYKEDVDGYDSNWLFANEIIDLSNLNDEVEIIEEDKKIEKLPPSYYENAGLTKQEREVAKKINEIIDKLNEGKDE